MGRRQVKGWLSNSTQILAGELSPADQTCRTASGVISQIPLGAKEDEDQMQLAHVVWGQIVPQLKLDTCFLHGGPSQVSQVIF